MNRATLTAMYLDEIKRRGVKASELVGSHPEYDMLNTFYFGRFLPRPVFLGHAERDQVYRDVENLRSALISLPDKLYGGDLAAFARAVGMTDVQVSAIMRSRGTAPTRLTRADLYADATGFRLLELNMGSAMGGMDVADLNRALLRHPVMADFVQAQKLEYVDTMREQANTIFAETGFAPGSFPMMAFTDWPSSYTTLEPYMRPYTARLRELGLDAHPCHAGQLEVRDDGRVWLGERAVDIIYVMVMIEDLLEYPDAPALMDPILDAAARGQVKMFSPMDAQLFASKGALAMLSDEQNRARFNANELASLDRILPWTRMVRRGPVTLEDGRTVDLVDYALTHKDDLALKPTLLHGGHGVLLGWLASTTDEMWQEQVRAAVDGPYVIQRRIRPVPELFPTEDGSVAPWLVAWGVFTMYNGYGGTWIRATSVESNIEVISVGGGAYAGCCFNGPPDQE